MLDEEQEALSGDICANSYCTLEPNATVSSVFDERIVFSILPFLLTSKPEMVVEKKRLYFTSFRNRAGFRQALRCLILRAAISGGESTFHAFLSIVMTKFMEYDFETRWKMHSLHTKRIYHQAKRETKALIGRYPIADAGCIFEKNLTVKPRRTKIADDT